MTAPRNSPKQFYALLSLVIFWMQLSLPAALRESYLIHQGGQTRWFEVAHDEIYLANAVAPGRVERLGALASSEAVAQHAAWLATAPGGKVHLVLHPRGVDRTEQNRFLLTSRVLVRLNSTANMTNEVIRLAGTPLERVAGLPGWYLATALQPGAALSLAEVLRGQPGVLFAEAQLARRAQPKLIPNDTYFSNQWHLRNTGQTGGVVGLDLGLTNVWNSFRGAGVTIGIVDDGLQYVHPDLAPNYVAAVSYNFNDGNGDPAPHPPDWHGTCVAGLAAAQGNNSQGVCGVAYEANLAGLRLIADWETDADDAASTLHSNAVIQIKNNSWGAADCPSPNGSILDGAGPLMKAALVEGTTTGRGGLGEVYVFAGGNGLTCGENVNYDSYANSPWVFAMGAVNDLGQQASYSEPGACLVAVAPSSSSGRTSITTTDLAGVQGYNTGYGSDLSNAAYTRNFGGTSAAAPMASGVIALMLQANPGLNWRDVKEILLRSSRKIQPTDADWATNASGLAHHHKFGGGLLNAETAIQMATNWTTLAPMTSLSLLQTNLGLAIPDNNTAGIARSFQITQPGFRVEQIVLTLTAPHPYWGDLAVTLTSPGGMTSRLTERISYVDNSYSYQAWSLTSVRHWGEKAEGVWTVRVADVVPSATGTLEALELTFYGSIPPVNLEASKSNAVRRVKLHVPAPGWNYALEVSTNLQGGPVTNWVPAATLTIGNNGRVTFVDTNTGPERFYRARLL